MRLLHIINSLGIGGAEVLLSNTIPLFNDHEQHLLTLHEPHDQLGALIPYLSSHECLQVTGISSWPQGIWKMRKAINRIKPDLIHVHLFLSGVMTKIATPKNIPLIYSLHSQYSIDAFSANRFALPLARLTARKHHHLIGVSEIVLDDYQTHVKNAGTGDVVYNMVGDEFFTEEIKEEYLPLSPLRCISIGTLKTQKNYQLTLDAFLALKNLPITIDIYGDGDQNQFQDFIDQHELKNVRLMGPSTAIVEVIKDYDLYVISSTYEGFGIALLEAMASGLPAVASDISVFKEVASDAIMYFDVNQPLELANLLRSIYEGSVSLNGHSERVKKQAAEIASSGSYFKALNALYRKYAASFEKVELPVYAHN